MLPQNLFYIAGYGVNLYLLLYILGVIPAAALAFWLARERGFSAQLVAWGIWVLAAGGLGGGLFIGTLIARYLPELPASWSLLSLASALLILFLGPPIGVKFTSEQLLAIQDMPAAPIALYIALRRVGCFTAGCCHGEVAEHLPWAVVFSHPASASIYRGIPVHPTQLYEVLACLLIVVGLLAIRKNPAWYGTQVWLFLAAYCAARFGIEFFRGDVRVMVGVLSLNQIVCLVGLAIGLAVLVWRMRFQRMRGQNDG